MPMQMVCSANAPSVADRRWQIEMSPRFWRSSLLPRPRWVSPWIRNLGGVHVAGWTEGGLTSGRCRFGPYRGVPSGQDVGDGSGVNPVGKWADCSGLSPELRCWRLQFGNLSIDTDGRLWRHRAPPSGASQLVVPHGERRNMISRFHDSLFAGHLGVSRTVFRLQSRVYWPGLRQDVQTYLASCTICLACRSPCPRRAPMGHVAVGHHWDRVAMDSQGKSICVSDGGLFLQMDRGLSVAGQGRLVCGGCFIPVRCVSLRYA